MRSEKAILNHNYHDECQDHFLTSCFSLHRTMEEGEKTADVDIESMWCNVDKCRQIIQQVLSGEQEDFYTVSSLVVFVYKGIIHLT